MQSKRALALIGLVAGALAALPMALTISPVNASGPGAPIPYCTPNRVTYDILYIRAPRFGDATLSHFPDTTNPMRVDPNTDLRLLHPDCSEELLFPRPEHQALVDAPIGNGVVIDPNLSFDGRWVVFGYFHDQSPAAINAQRGVSRYGADLYRLDLLTRQVVRLTRQGFTPNTGNNADFRSCDSATPVGQNCPRFGVVNIGPAFFAASDPARPGVIFTSSRNQFLTPKPFGFQGHVLQLFRMDWDGQNVEQIGFLNQSRALHPLQLSDGRILFTSWENQGVRDDRLFNLWFINPDGTGWNSGSGLGERAIGHHFATEMPDGDIVVVRYYNLNNNGFGDLIRFPVDPPGPDFRPINDPGTYMPFQRPGQVDLTNWADTPYTLAEDVPAPCAVGQNMYGGQTCDNASRIGKVTHPSAAPDGSLLLVYTPGPANHRGGGPNTTPYYDAGLYVAPPALATGGFLPMQLTRILNNPAYNEQWPRAVAPFSAVFPGQSQPPAWPEYRNLGEPEHGLTANTPYGLVGSSSLIHRDTAPRPGAAGDPDHHSYPGDYVFNWFTAGADAGVYTDNDIYAVRIIALMPSTDRRYPDDGPRFDANGMERIRILGELPVRKDGVLDPLGDVDTSFLVRIPANTPFTFQTLDRNGMVLNMAQTWHQVLPGEARYDCGGCHAHTQTELDFEETAAGRAGSPAVDFALQTPLLNPTTLNGAPGTLIQTTTATTVEYFRDIRPILDAKCVSCHTGDNGGGNLNLAADAEVVQCGQQRWPGTYYRLARDRSTADCPQYGLGTPPGSYQDYFFAPQTSRYIRAFQSRQSLLVWMVYGQRLDGRSNDTRTHDIDFTPSAAHTGLLSWGQRLTIARWIDIGSPVDLCSAPAGCPPQQRFWGYFEDDLRPTLWAGPTLTEARAGPVSSVIVAAYDLESGLAPSSLSVTLDRTVGAQPAGTNLASGASLVNGNSLSIALPAPIDLVASRATLTVSVRDNAGHVTTVVRNFASVAPLTQRVYITTVSRR